jgi:hypothetical protein
MKNLIGAGAVYLLVTTIELILWTLFKSRPLIPSR